VSIFAKIGKKEMNKSRKLRSIADKNPVFTAAPRSDSSENSMQDHYFLTSRQSAKFRIVPIQIDALSRNVFVYDLD